MEQKSLLDQMLQFIKTRRLHRRWQQTVTAMAAVVVFATTYLLILPAITMEHNTFELTAVSSKTSPGEAIITELYAEAANSSEETCFVLNADGNNAGLDTSQLDFDENNIVTMQDDNGQEIALHREYSEDGIASYWFMLNGGQSTRFSLPWINGTDRYHSEKIAINDDSSSQTPETGTDHQPPDTETNGEDKAPPADGEPEQPITQPSDQPQEPGNDAEPSLPSEPTQETAPAADTSGNAADSEQSASADSGTASLSVAQYNLTGIPESANTSSDDSADDSNTSGDTADNGNTSDDAADNGNTSDDAADNGNTSDDTADNGNTSDDTADNGNTSDDTADNGNTSDDSADDGNPSDDAADDGNTSDDAADDGNTSDDTADDSNTSDDTADDSNTSDDTADDGNTSDDAADDGNTSGGGSSGTPTDSNEETTYYIETFLDQQGDPEQEGFLTIAYGSGSTPEEAKGQTDAELELSWLKQILPEDEYLCTLEEHIHDPVLCYDQDGVLICTLEEHVHGENCILSKVYHYEDSFISVTAIPDHPQALPDGAEFRVTPVTASAADYNYNAYMQALNQDIQTEDGSLLYTEENTLLYDIAFLTETADGQIIECQPAQGTVSVQFTFRERATALIQQEDEFGQSAAPALDVVHLPLTDQARQQAPTTAEATAIGPQDIETEKVAASVSADTVAFTLESFSLVAFIEKENGTVVPIDNVEPGIGYTCKDILGNAINYGLVAQEIDKIAHMDTTLAASHVKGDGGNITAGAYTGQTGSPILIGSITGSLKVDGQKCMVYTTEEAAKSITLQNGSIFSYTTENDIWNQVTSMIGHAEAVSAEMAAQRSYQVMKYGWYWNGKENVQGWYEDQNEKEIDISSLPDGTYYINGNSFLKKDDVRIKKNSGQTIVFNLSEESVNIKRFSITDVDTGKSASSATSDASIADFAQTVVFNMPNATKVNIESGILGILIAPKAEVSIGSTSSGWIIADKIKNPGGEWHFVYQGFKDNEPLEVSIQVQKTLDGEAPDRDTKFSFQLEQWDNTQWVNKTTVQNFEGVVLFRETFNSVGTYWFRISEVDGGGAYQYDNTQYLVKAEVTELQNDGTLILQAVLTYYKADAITQATDDTKVDKLIFHNTTGGAPDYVLPETGGPGSMPFTIAGFTLLILTGLLYMTQRRKAGDTH